MTEFIERKVTAEDQLKRIDIPAPQDGYVLVHTVGGVITAGDAIMMIVPEADNLKVEAKVDPRISTACRSASRAALRDVQPADHARAHGTVTLIAADASNDQRTGLISYFTIRIGMTAEEIARLGDVKLALGMPVEVFVQTGERTMFSYLMKPLHD